MLSALGNDTSSFLHRIDPRVRVCLTVGYAFFLVACQSWTVLVVGMGVSLACVLLARLPLLPTLKRFGGLLLFLGILLLTMPLTTPGTPWVTWGPLSWSVPGTEAAARIALKAGAIMLMATALLATMEPAHMGHALHRLGVPGKLVHLFLFLIRYLDVMEQEYTRLRNAMRCRGFRPSCSFHALRSLGYLLGMLFLRSLDRAERILQAMKCRGFAGRFYILDPKRLGAVDAFAGLAFAFLLTGLGYLEWR